MKNIVYNTDAKWFAFLRKNELTSNVNFWRKDLDAVDVPRNTPFYFKIRSTQLIAGRAKLIRTEQMTFSEAWQTFGANNGVESFPEFVEQVCEVTGAGREDDIKCLVLDELEFLPDSQWVSISENLFPRARPGGVYLEDNDFKEILKTFESILGSKPPQKPVIQQTRIAIEELVVPANFHGRIMFIFDGGEIKIRKEVF